MAGYPVGRLISAPVAEKMMAIEGEEPLAFASLPADVLCSVTENLDVQSLARFAAACSACRAVAHGPLRHALLQVLKRCLRGQPWDPDDAASAGKTETFRGCSKIWASKSLLLGHLTDVTFVGSYAFRDCRSLSRCVLPKGLVTIGTNAFARCTSLAKLTLPATLTSIGESAFRGCYSLTSLTLPASLVTIGDDAFHGCYALASVKFPASLVTIGLGAFRDCSSLTSLTFPASLTTIGDCAFADCPFLSSLTFPASLITTGTCVFAGCSSLTHVDFSLTATTIGWYAFDGCKRLVKLTLPAALSRIETGTFGGCSALVELTLPAGLNHIGEAAFRKCTSLKTLTFPDAPRLTYVGDQAPTWTYSLKDALSHHCLTSCKHPMLGRGICLRRVHLFVEADSARCSQGLRKSQESASSAVPRAEEIRG